MAAKKFGISTYVEPLQDKPESGYQPQTNSQYQDDYNDHDQKEEQYDDDFDDYDPNDYKPSKKKSKSKGSSKKSRKKKMTPQEFKDVDLESLFFSDDENFDIAKKICEFYDEQFGDKDTV